MNCPKCGKVMENLGNVSGIVFTSIPPQWIEIHVCRCCKIKKTVRVHGKLGPIMSYLEGYEED